MIARLLSAYCIVLAAAVGVHFIVTPLYADGSGNFPLWAIFDWFMAAGILIALVASLIWKVELGRGEAGEAGMASYIETNVLFYAALALALLFFSTWFASLMAAEINPIERSLLWITVDTATVAVVGAAGWRLWPMPGRA